MSKSLSNKQLERIVEMFRKHLGRELTKEEVKYLGLSCGVASIDDLEFSSAKNQLEGKNPAAKAS